MKLGIPAAIEVAYLAGPMRGHPEYNFPAFHAAAAALRAKGWTVWNPAEKDEAGGFDPKTDEPKSLREYMLDDLPMVLRADVVVVLPGWSDSTGASLEAHVAVECGIPVWSYDPETGRLGDAVTEGADLLTRFHEELRKATGDGAQKRSRGEKPPWYADDAHEGAIFSHLTKWKRGESVDPDSGAHPLVHAAWRCLAIACREAGNVPIGGTA